MDHEEMLGILQQMPAPLFKKLVFLLGVGSFIPEEKAQLEQAIALLRHYEGLPRGSWSMLEKKLDRVLSEGLEGAQPIPAETQAPATIPAKLSGLPSVQTQLMGREAEVQVLDGAWDSSQTRLLTFVAEGGQGKTVLIKHWLHRMEEDGFRGAEAVYVHSFYKQGSGDSANADTFLQDALVFFDLPHPEGEDSHQKAARLAQFLRARRSLLYLDGIEPLLAQPPAPARLRDDGLKALLQELGWSMKGLCILTSRRPVLDLEEFKADSHYVEQVLEPITEEAGEQLLVASGATAGTQAREAAREFGQHGFALDLMGRFVKQYLGGDLDRRAEVPDLKADGETPLNLEAVLAALDAQLPPVQRTILRLVGLFDRPAREIIIRCLREAPAIEGVTEPVVGFTFEQWFQAIAELRGLGLIWPADPKEVESVDAHPRVRAYFEERLREENPVGWKEAHSRIFDRLRTDTMRLPGTLREMEPLFQAVAHGCRAGRHQQALDDVYVRRIQRGNELFSTAKLGAIGSDLAALSGFFETPWNRPVVGLHPRARSYVLNAAGFDLRAQGRLGEAVEPFQAALEGFVAEKHWANAAIQAGNLSELFLTRGDLARAEEFARRSVDYADRSGNAFQRMAMRTALADALHQAGRTAEGSALFREAEGLQAERQPEFPLLYSLRGFRFCDLLLGRGECEEVLRRARKLFEWRLPSDSLLDIALDHLSLGRAEAWIAARAKAAESRAAAGHLDEAVDGLRKAGDQEFVSRGLLARAELGRLRGDLAAAWRDVGEAQGIAERGGMRLHLADCHLEAARLHQAAGQPAEARQRLETAEVMVNEMGYHRRDPEVHLAWARLGVLEADGDAARARLAKARQRVDEMEMHLWDDEVAALAAELGD